MVDTTGSSPKNGSTRANSLMRWTVPDLSSEKLMRGIVAMPSRSTSAMPAWPLPSAARWCAPGTTAIVDGASHLREDEPARRVPGEGHKSPP
jgi:hypothetical protein